MKQRLQTQALLRSLNGLHPLWLWALLLTLLLLQLQPWVEWRCAALSTHLPAWLLLIAALAMLLCAQQWRVKALRWMQYLLGAVTLLLSAPALLFSGLTAMDGLSCTRQEGFLHTVQWELREEQGSVLRTRHYVTRCQGFMDEAQAGTMRTLEVPGLPWRLLLEDRRCDWTYSQ